jgi:hypothetical protein
VGLLNNLRAGRSNAQVSRALGLLASHPDVIHVETDSARMLPEALAEFTRHEVDLLVVNGGDGTLQYALTELLTNPDLASVRCVAPLRGGRTNMTGTDLGAHPDPVAGLRAVLTAAAAGRIAERYVDRPVLRITSGRRETVQFGMFFGIGMLQRAVRLVHRAFAPPQQGVFGAGLVTAALLAKIIVLRPTDGIVTPDKAEIRIGDETLPPAEFYLGYASTLHRLFLRMNPFWGDGPGGIRVTAISSQPRHVMKAAPGILCGRPWQRHVTRENGYYSANAEEAAMRIGCGYTIDGEIFEPLADETVILEADRRIQLVRA